MDKNINDNNRMIETGKELLKQVSTLGIGVIFGNFVTFLIPEVCIPLKICSYVGTFILGSMASDKAEEYIDSKTEEIQQFIVTAKDELNKILEEG